MSYFDAAINPKKAVHTLTQLVKCIRGSGVEYDYIALRGSSGVSLATALAIALGKPIVIVRKPGESSHGTDVVFPEGPFLTDGRYYIIVDDFISTGATVAAIVERLTQSQLTLVGVFCYGIEGSQYRSIRDAKHDLDEGWKIVTPIFDSQTNEHC